MGMPVWRSCARILGTVPPRRLSQNSEYPRSPIAGYLQSPPLCPFAASCFLLKPLLDQLLPVGSPGQSGRAGCTQLLRRHDNGRWR